MNDSARKTLTLTFTEKIKRLKIRPSPEKKTKEFIVGFYHRLENI